MTSDQIRARVAALGDWFHNLDLRGVQTAPGHFLGDFPRSKFRHFAHLIPEDLQGASVLDVGCNGGFYALEMLRRGAGRVLGIDSDDRYLAQARLAAEVSGVGAALELRKLSVFDVATIGERFDLVLFMGVLYHLRHPLLALDLLHAHVVRDQLLFQSMLRGADEIVPVAGDYPFEETRVFEQPGFPGAAFVEHKYAGDQTNWWIPNRAGAEAMLRSSGFQIVQRAEDDVYLCRRRELTPLEAIDRAVYPAR